MDFEYKDVRQKIDDCKTIAMTVRIFHKTFRNLFMCFLYIRSWDGIFIDHWKPIADEWISFFFLILESK